MLLKRLLAGVGQVGCWLEKWKRVWGGGVILLNECEKNKQRSDAFRLGWAETRLVAGSRDVAMMSTLKGGSK